MGGGLVIDTCRWDLMMMMMMIPVVRLKTLRTKSDQDRIALRFLPELKVSLYSKYIMINRRIGAELELSSESGTKVKTAPVICLGTLTARSLVSHDEVDAQNLPTEPNVFESIASSESAIHPSIHPSIHPATICQFRRLNSAERHTADPSEIAAAFGSGSWWSRIVWMKESSKEITTF